MTGEPIYEQRTTLDLLGYVEDDGGRVEAGFRGEAGDCVTRAIAIATGRPYLDVYQELAALEAQAGRPRSARNGIDKRVTRAYMAGLGWQWTPTMSIGSGCQVHLADDFFVRVYGEPVVFAESFVVQLSRHVTAVVDGEVRDTYDPRRDGTRCVYGYWREQGRA